MEKLKYVHVIGGSGRPLPTMTSKDAISEDGYTHLGVVDKDRPIHIDSNLEYGAFIGELYRNLPTPSLLEDFWDSLENRREANVNPKARMLETFLGSAGAGKTFRAELTGRLIHEKGAILVDCGGKNLKELLFVTVIDNPDARDLFSKIDSLLERYNSAGTKSSSLKATVMQLKKNLGEAFSEENGRVGIDWVMAAQNGVLEKKDTRETLDFIAEVNGLNKVDTSALGLKTQEGPLIQAWKEGRPIILDEYNKSHGGGESLQVLLQVLIGQSSKHTVSDGGKSFTFDRKDKKPGFFVTVTGNTIDDGGSTHGLEQSAYSRLSPKFIADANRLDWEHRISQCLTGVPISTLWRCQENVWKVACQEAAEQGKPDPFINYCHQIRMAGLTPEEKKCVPESQLVLIDHYDAVLQAASQLAKFYIDWGNAINPDMQKEDVDYISEVDEEYAKSVGLNLRKMIEHVNTSLQPRVDGVDGDQNPVDLSVDFDKPISTARPKRFEPLEKFGTNLMMTIVRSVNNTTYNDDPNAARRKSQLRKYLYTIMEENGIIPSSKKNTKKGGIRPLEELLNIHIERPEEKYKEFSALICDDLRARYPELGGQEDDVIIPPATFASVFQNFEGNHDPDEILMPNISKLEEFADKPFEVFKVQRINEDTDLAGSSSITKSQFLISLTFPEGKEAFEQLFSTAKAKPTTPAKGGGFLMGSFLGVAEREASADSDLDRTPTQGKGSKGPTDIFVNVVQTQDDNILVIHNKKSKETLMVGSGKISQDLAQSLKGRNVAYLTKDGSPKELNDAFKQVAGVESSEVLAYLSEDLGAESTSFSRLIDSLSPGSLTKTILFQPKGR